jgi:hypothetical protein
MLKLIDSTWSLNDTLEHGLESSCQQSMAEVPAAALFAVRRLTETYGKDLNYLDR